MDNQNHNLVTNRKEHYKMYKAGKSWLFASIVVASLGMGGAALSQRVSADSEPQQSQSTSKTTASQADSQNGANANKSADSQQTTSQGQTTKAADNSQNQATDSSKTDSTSQKQESAGQSGLTNREGDDSTANSQAQKSTDNNGQKATDSDSQKSTDNDGQKATDNTDNKDQKSTDSANQQSSDSKTANVSPQRDFEKDRQKFNDDIAQNKPITTPTSNTVDTPDQVKNIDQYKEEAQKNNTLATANDYASFQKAWADSKVNYIDVQNDFSADSAMTARPANASIIVNGNGHTIDMKNYNLRMGAMNKDNQNVTLSNINFQEGQPGDDAEGLTFLYGGDSSRLSINIDNFSLQPSSNKMNPVRLAFANDAKITFSGNNNISNANEITRGVTSINIADGAKLHVQRTSNDYKNSMFYFNRHPGQTATGYGNNLNVGDGADLSFKLYGNNNGDYAAVYDNIDNVTVGDNVRWEQSGFQYVLNGTQGSKGDAKFIFGQSLYLNAPKTTQPNAIKLTGTQYVEFNANTDLTINQWVAGNIISTGGSGSSVRFISPKALHLTTSDGTGKPMANGAGVIGGAGTVQINNSKLVSWNGTNTSDQNVDGDSSEEFYNMTIKGGADYISHGGEEVTKANSLLIKAGTREIQTREASKRNVYVQYKDQYGNIIANKDGQKIFTAPLPDKPFIGMFVPLKTQALVNTNMPENYKWALDGEVPASAKKDKQSGGDPSDTHDDGDATGQAYVGILPTGRDNTYTIYVYGQDEAVPYVYVDQNGNEIQPKTVSQQAPVTANYGNVIDWTDNYYKTTTMPENCQYDQKANQPKTMTVGTDNPITKIYVQNSKSVKVTSQAQKDFDNAATEQIAQIKQSKNLSQTDQQNYVDQIQKTLQPQYDQQIQAASGDDQNKVATKGQTAINKVRAQAQLADAQKAADQHTANNNQSIDQDAAKQANQAISQAAQAAINSDDTDSVDKVDQALNNAKNKFTANQNVNDHAQEAIDRVNQQQNLSNDDRAKAVQTIQQQQRQANQTIQSENNSDQLAADQQAANTNIDRTRAKAELADQAAQAKQAVAKQAASQNIDVAATNKKIDQAQAAGDQAIDQADDQHIDGQRDQAAQQMQQVVANPTTKGDPADQAAAKKAVEQQAQQSNDALNKMAHLTPEQKADYQQKVAADKAAADKQLDGDSDADSLSQHRDAALQQLQKDQAQAQLQDATNAAKSDVDQMKQGIDQDAAKQQLDAQNAAGQKAIGQAQSSAAVQQQAQQATDQIAADKALDAAADQSLAAINAQQPLANDKKQAAVAAVKQHQNEAKQNVQKATNSQDVAAAKTAGLQNMNQDVSAAQLNSAKEDAKNRLLAHAGQTKAAIKQIPNTNKDYDGQVDQAAQNGDQHNGGTKGIDQAKDLNAVNQALNNGQTAVDQVKAQAQADGKQNLADAKAANKAQLDQAAQQAKSSIAQQGALSDGDRQAFQKQVDEANQAAKDQIDQDNSKDQMDKDYRAGGQNINQAVQDAQLAGAKNDAKNRLQAYGSDRKQTLANIKNVDPADLAKAQAAIDQDVTNGQGAIDRQNDAAGINQSLQDGQHAVDNVNVSDENQAAQRSAIAAVNQAAQQASQAVNQLNPMAEADKQKEKNQIQADAGQAIQQIQAAGNDQNKMNQAKDQGIQKIQSDVKAATNNNQDQGALSAAAKQANQEIGSQPGIDKDKAQSAVEKVRQDAQAKIDDANRRGDTAAAQQALKEAQVKIAADEALDDAASHDLQTIDQQPNLTPAEKQARQNAVRQRQEAAKDDIFKAKNPEQALAVKAAVRSDLNHMASQAQVEDAKRDANARLDAHEAQVDAAIDNLPASADKAALKQSVAAAKQEAQANVNKADNLNDVNQAFTDGVAKMDQVKAQGADQSQQPLSDRKQAANQELDQAAQAAAQRIDSLQPLSAADKQAAKAAVQQAAGAAKQAVNQAADGAATDQALQNGLAQVATGVKDAQLTNAKTDAKNRLAAYGADAKKGLSHYQNVSGDQLDQAAEAIDQEVANGQGNIDRQSDVPGVKTALDQSEAAIDKVNPADQHLAKRSAALAALNQAAQKASDQVNQNQQLSAADKQAAQKQISDDANQAAAQVQSAADDQAIDHAQQAGVAQLDKDGAQADLQGAVNAAKVAVKNQSGIDQGQVNQAIDQTAADGQKAIANGQNADQVAQALDLAKSKAQAQQALAAAASQDMVAVDQNQALSNDQKQAAKQAVQNDLQAATKAVNAATNKDAVQQAQSNGVNKMNQDVTDAQVQNAQADAKKRLADHAAATKAAINALPNLSADDKAALNKQVDAAADAASEKIGQAKDLAGVNQALNNGQTAIDQVKAQAAAKAKQSLNDLRQSNKDLLAKAQAAANASLDQQQALTADQRNDLKKQVQQAADAAAAKIDQDQDAGSVNQDFQNGRSAMNDVVTAGQLNAGKNDAKSRLTAYGDRAKQALSQYQNLSDEDLQQAAAAIDAAVQNGQGNIDRQTTLAAVADKLANAQQAVDQIKPKDSNQGNRANAVNQINAAAAKAIQAVNQNQHLSASERQAAQDQINHDADQAIAQVQAAKDGQAITAATDAAAQTLNKDAAQADLQGAVAAAKAAVQGQAGIDQNQANQAIAQAATAGQQAIANGQNADQVANGLNLAKAKLTAQAALATAASRDLTAVDQDQNLTANQKQAAKQAIQADWQAARQQVNAAADTAAVTNAQTAGVNKMDQDVTNAQVQHAQADAKKRLADHANQTKAAIAAMANLSADQKQALDQAIDQAAATATAKIDAGQDQAAVEQAFNDGKAAIDQIQQEAQAQAQATTLADAKTVAKAQLADHANQVKAAIAAMTNLSADQKQALDQAIDQAEAAAIAKIDASQSRGAVQQAFNDGKAAIDRVQQDADSQDQAATLANAKVAAKAQLTNHANQVKAAIEAMAGFSAAERTQAVAQIDALLQAGLTAIDQAQSAAAATQAMTDSAQAMDQFKQAFAAGQKPATPVQPAETAQPTAQPALPATSQQAGKSNALLTASLSMLATVLTLGLAKNKKRQK
ncbi:DUF1542 domain-containing protein [Leuconostocaceae bacterium ESL0958]|nr:DUF1542 domain-containing protein [Leuconostocaceae bacterium ESL0958]